MSYTNVLFGKHFYYYYINLDWGAITILRPEPIESLLGTTVILGYSYSEIITIILAAVITALKLLSSQTFLK